MANGEIARFANFSFCHNVFKSRLLQTREKASICRKGLIMYYVVFSHMDSIQHFPPSQLATIPHNLKDIRAHWWNGDNHRKEQMAH